MLAIVSGKGGCGKTTITLGLAQAISATGTAVQAVDLDVELPDLHVLAGVDRTPTLCSATSSPSLQRAAGRPGVYIAAAPRMDETATIESSIDALPRRPTLLDAPAGAGRDAIRPIAIADAVFVVTTHRREAIEDALKTVAVAGALSTPVVGVGVRSDSQVPVGLAEQFDVDDSMLVRLPETSGDPLSTDRFSQRLDAIAENLLSRRQEREKGYTTRSPTE